MVCLWFFWDLNLGQFVFKLQMKENDYEIIKDRVNIGEKD